ncbi:dihydrolipoyl dehydrogenase family protein [Williamsia sp. SKLECPSW1]
MEKSSPDPATTARASHARGEPEIDLLVLGGGTAGIVAAKTAARLGARVVLVERDRTGGDCLWTGCVPSKAILAAAHAATAARRAGRLGVSAAEVTVDFAAVRAHVRSSIDRIAPIDSPDALRAEGVVVLHGAAVVTGPDSVVVGERHLLFRQLVIATGAQPTIPEIPGSGGVPTSTSETIWDLTELPARLAVLGGGSVGCELGQAFARLGSTVTIVEGGERILAREDPDAAEVVAAALAADGVTVLTGVRPAEVVDGHLILTDGRRVAADHLLVAAGRTPTTHGLGLDAAGVDVDGRGHVVVDRYLRTSNPRIWACGDVTGHPQFTHTAGMHGSVAASNAVLGVPRSVERTGQPRVTFTDPEVAAVGVTTPAPGLRVLTLPHDEVDRAVAEGRTDGFTRLILDKRHRVRGATVVGPRAGETIGELALAVRLGLRTRDIAATTHPYPTFSDGAWNAAIADVRGQLDAPATRRALRVIARVRARWVRWSSG